MRKRLRKRLRGRPRFEVRFRWRRKLEEWTRAFIMKNRWRVPAEWDEDDLFQDCFCYFLHCQRRYADKAQSQAHFASLYRSCIFNHFNDLSNASTRQRARPTILIDDLGVMTARVQPRWVELEPTRLTYEAQEALRLMLLEAPLVVKHVIKALGLDDALIQSKPRPEFEWDLFGRRETTNEYLCRLVGIDSHKVNLVSIIRLWIREGAVPKW